MLIFYKTDPASNKTTPLVLIDALCTDDQFGTKEINALVKSGVPKEANLMLAPEKIFSCEYSFTYSQNALPTEAGFRSDFFAQISSPPAEFVSAFSPVWFLSAQSAVALDIATRAYASSQTNVVYACFVVRDVSNKPIQYSFIAFKGEMKPDAFATTATLAVTGALYDDKTIRANSVCEINLERPLQKQITDYMASHGITAVFSPDDDSQYPVNDIFIPPGRLNKVLDAICAQNLLVHSGIDSDKKTVFINARGQKGAPKTNNLTNISFIGASGGLIANNFAISEYTKANFSTQFFFVKPFDSLVLINDTRSSVFEGAAKANSVAGFDAYVYFVLKFSFEWSRDKSELKIEGINNWLLGQQRIDELLEKSIYAGRT